VNIRPATEHDLTGLNDIYNHYVLTNQATFDVEPVSLDARREWFTHYDTRGPHRLLVAVDDEAVLGFASSSRFRDRAAYDTSIETSVYLAPTACGRGIGRALYDALFTSLVHEPIHRAYALIALPNPASVSLHERFGFAKVAHLTEVGRKFDQWWDVAWYEKPLN
jgi:phosphinothricin acetyltransferase